MKQAEMKQLRKYNIRIIVFRLVCSFSKSVFFFFFFSCFLYIFLTNTYSVF